jgi:hypothetical protein
MSDDDRVLEGAQMNMTSTDVNGDRFADAFKVQAAKETLYG